jgi:hypothetical protein
MENSKGATLIRIHPQDNVGVLVASVRGGQSICFQGLQTTAAGDTALGHKFALKAIPAGGKIYKYGVAIGSAKHDIQRGEHVHLHNLQSDYLPTYTLEGESHFKG